MTLNNKLRSSSTYWTKRKTGIQ